jgi:hypothetical protein
MQRNEANFRESLKLQRQAMVSDIDRLIRQHAARGQGILKENASGHAGPSPDARRKGSKSPARVLEDAEWAPLEGHLALEGFAGDGGTDADVAVREGERHQGLETPQRGRAGFVPSTPGAPLPDRWVVKKLKRKLCGNRNMYTYKGVGHFICLGTRDGWL